MLLTILFTNLKTILFKKKKYKILYGKNKF